MRLLHVLIVAVGINATFAIGSVLERRSLRSHNAAEAGTNTDGEERAKKISFFPTHNWFQSSNDNLLQRLGESAKSKFTAFSKQKAHNTDIDNQKFALKAHNTDIDNQKFALKAHNTDIDNQKFALKAHNTDIDNQKFALIDGRFLTKKETDTLTMELVMTGEKAEKFAIRLGVNGLPKEKLLAHRNYKAMEMFNERKELWNGLPIDNQDFALIARKTKIDNQDFALKARNTEIDNQKFALIDGRFFTEKETDELVMKSILSGEDAKEFAISLGVNGLPKEKLLAHRNYKAMDMFNKKKKQWDDKQSQFPILPE